MYGVPKDTNKADIVEDLGDSDIFISDSDIILMRKGSPSVVSYNISVKTRGFEKGSKP